MIEIPHVYLAPGSESHIAGDPAFITRYTLPSTLALAALEDSRAVVYELNGSVLRNATARYRAQAPALEQARSRVGPLADEGADCPAMGALGGARHRAAREGGGRQAR